MATDIKWLLQPLRVGQLMLQNRLVFGPVHTNLNSVTGEVSQQLIDTYQNAARGGPALVIIEASAVDGRHAWPIQVRIDSKEFEPGLQKLVETIHAAGVPVVIQLHHGGMYGKDPVSPSGIPSYSLAQKYLGTGKRHIQPRVMGLAEIEEARDLFIEAAVRARNIEFDGVLLHGATSYLLEQFVSPHTNKRTDRFGGNLQNRMTLPLEIVRGIRQRCGPSFPVGYSLVADELYPDGEGITLEESIAFARALEREGVDWVDATRGNLETYALDPRGGTTYRQFKGLFDLSEPIKKAVAIPVFARCAGEHNPVKWAEAIARGLCDAIQMARPALCDPELPRKIAAGRLSDVRLCIRDNYCYELGVEKGWQVGCSVNAQWGREKEFAIVRTPTPKNVLVVGGGPAGLEAARVAALRGHTVTLVEKAARLGGNMRIASLSPGKEDYQAYFGDWLERQCRQAGVTIEPGKEATPGFIKRFKPDVVIVATGATPLIPPIPGIKKKHVVTAEDVFLGRAPVGEKVIVAGGGGVGVDVADFITEKGLAKSVSIIEMTSQICGDVFPVNRGYIVSVLLPGAGVKIFTNMRIDEITDEGVAATDEKQQKCQFEADTVVLALGYTPSTALYESLRGKVPELYRIGDCVKPRKIGDAVREAAYLARQI